ncbi:hypothetical protein AKJ41_03835 [candidate division MSBL1 archaeon SCGC-AAA259O05]|uniref:Gfo/Idh/MocA-like oxidoreductase C-terminal domain-containing protein n=1 Tax=candidate division MSBL1 archaeon SCGC-AAA259O05 TaxID=1698271 RepID=A0A133V2K0_9EURY|nr:hypothetical protein AKJ41_03835 [candidate division MSBL1 archaeon SCGC-AAA259O05]
MGVEVENYDHFNNIQIHGTEGIIKASKEKYEIKLYSGEEKEPEVIKLKEKSGFKKQMGHFLDCIREEKTPRTSGIKERNNLAVIEAGYKSMAKNKAIEVGIRTE